MPSQHSSLSTQHLVMGTRGSPLALAQARQVARALEEANENLRIEEKIIRTTGDKNQTAALPAIGGKGVFTLEIEAALLKGEIDFAVHSLKDLPPDFPAGLCLGAVPPRATADDVCILRADLGVAEYSEDSPLSFLPRGAKVGTSSLRRRAQLLYLRPDLQVDDVRGNIDTRLKKMDDGGFDAIILAGAGLFRLGVARDEKTLFSLRNDFLPAAGQGALALECRTDDARVLTALQKIECEKTRAEITAERALLWALNAGCSTPLGARAEYSESSEYSENELHLRAAIFSEDGTQRLFAEDRAPNSEAQTLGKNVAAMLRQQESR